jgi:hypothetical protein
LKMNYFVIHYLFQTKNFEMKGIKIKAFEFHEISESLKF